MDFTLTDTQKKDLLKLARLTISEELGYDCGIKSSELDFTSQIFLQKFGAFVTLHKNGQLRGCIGYIVGFLTLTETIEKMALSAAFEDPRFPSLSKEEINDIDIEISILSPIVKVNDINEIVVGKDGLIVSNRVNTGLLLPQVAVEYKWTRDEFLDHTCMKAGLSPDSWRKNNIEIKKFSAMVFGEKDFC